MSERKFLFSFCIRVHSIKSNAYKSEAKKLKIKSREH